MIDSNTSNKIRNLQLILAIVVIVSHTSNYTIYTSLGRTPLYFIELLFEKGKFANMCFFSLSAFLFYQNFDFAILKEKLKKRVSSLLIPYLIWNLIGYAFYVVLHFCFSKYINRQPPELGVLSIFKQALVGEYNITWFLRYLMVYNILSPLFYYVAKRSYVLGLCELGILLAVGSASQNAILLYGTDYVLGMLLALFCKDDVTRRYNKKEIIWATEFFIFTLILLTFFHGSELKWFAVITGWVCVVSCWISLDFLNKYCFSIAKYSFLFYVAHTFILESIEKVMLITFGDTLWGGVIDYFLSPVLTIIVLICMGSLLSRYKKVWSILVGKR